MSLLNPTVHFALEGESMVARSTGIATDLGSAPLPMERDPADMSDGALAGRWTSESWSRGGAFADDSGASVEAWQAARRSAAVPSDQSTNQTDSTDRTSGTSGIGGNNCTNGTGGTYGNGGTKSSGTGALVPAVADAPPSETTSASALDNLLALAPQLAATPPPAARILARQRPTTSLPNRQPGISPDDPPPRLA